MKTRDFVAMGIPAGPSAETAKQILQQARTARRSTQAVLHDLARGGGEPGNVRQRLRIWRTMSRTKAKELFTWDMADGL
jgi:hypothetical protein